MSENHFPLPYPESFWVIPGQFMAGEYPGHYDELATRRRVQALIHSGIEVFIDLTHPNDFMEKYSSILFDEAAGYMKTVNYGNFPIPDRSIISQPEMSFILDHIDSSIANQKSVYVHCIAGIGRTGTVVGCYLVRHGLSGDQALMQLKSLRQNIPSGWARSPEADEQVEFVRNWQVGQ